MVEMFKTIPQNVGKPLTTREKNQKLITDIGGGWYLEKCKRGSHRWREQNSVKRHRKGRILLKTNSFNLICGGMIGNPNYIGTFLNGLIRNQQLKEVNNFKFLQKLSILIIKIEQLILLVILNWLHWILLIFMKENRRMKI